MSSTVHQGTASINPTSRIEQLLLGGTIVLLPLQDHLPSLGGFSIIYFLFALSGVYLVLNRPNVLAKTAKHPVFIAAYIFLFVSAVIELSHSHASHSVLLRIVWMIGGGILVGALCRDKQGLRAGVYGYLIAGIWMSVLLFLTSYGALQEATAVDFKEASRVRRDIFEDRPLNANLNLMAFIAAQGAVVALALTLTAAKSLRRNLFLGIAALCFVASFLSLSRSGALAAIIAGASVVYACGMRFGKTILVAAVIGAGVFTAVPDAVWSRMTFSMEARDGKLEGRARIHKATVAHFSEYVVTGVGAGNFWRGKLREFLSLKSGHVKGAHNCFMQVMIYWGLAGFIAYLAMAWQAYRCVPNGCRGDELALCVLGIAVSLLIYSQISHVVYSKVFSLGLGLVLGARLWLWPNGIVEYITSFAPLRNATSQLHSVQPLRLQVIQLALRK